MVLSRLNNITYIRFAATLMVVVYHSLCLYTNRWAYPDTPSIALYEHLAEILNKIDMPAFVFISGYLFSRQITTRKKFQSRGEMIVYKLKRLLIPYLFWLVINLLLVPESLTLTKLLNGFNQLWFLPMLLQMFIIAIITLPVWIKFSKTISLLSLSSMLLFFFTAYYKGINLPFPFVKTFLPIFYFGIITERFQLLNFKKRFHPCMLPIAIAIYTLACIFLCTANPSIRDFVIKLSSYSVIFLTMSVLQTQKDVSNKFVSTIEKYSMGIYLIHHILIQYTLTNIIVLRFMGTHYIVGPIFIFTLSLSVSLLLTFMLSKVPHLQCIV